MVDTDILSGVDLQDSVSGLIVIEAVDGTVIWRIFSTFTVNSVELEEVTGSAAEALLIKLILVSAARARAPIYIYIYRV